MLKTVETIHADLLCLKFVFNIGICMSDPWIANGEIFLFWPDLWRQQWHTAHIFCCMLKDHEQGYRMTFEFAKSAEQFRRALSKNAVWILRIDPVLSKNAVWILRIGLVGFIPNQAVKTTKKQIKHGQAQCRMSEQSSRYRSIYQESLHTQMAFHPDGDTLGNVVSTDNGEMSTYFDRVCIHMLLN